MKLLGISIVYLLYSFSLFGQCGGYLDLKFKADSSYKSNSFKKASYYYSKCLAFEEKKRIDYYYTTISYIKINQADSALLFLKIAAKKGLRYNTLKDFYSDSIIQIFTTIKKWRKTINLVKLNTEKYVRNNNIDSVLLQTILIRKELDQKYRSPQMNELPLNISDSLWQIQKKYDYDNQLWLKGEIEKNVLVNSNKEQIYGTQFETIIVDNKIADLKLKPTINQACLNKRRLYMELEPVEDYLEYARKRYVQKE